MKKRYKALSMALIGVVTLGLLAGCNKATDTNGKAGEDKKDSPVNLVVWGGVPAENGPKALVDEWNKKNPNVQVEYVRFVNDDAGNTKLDTALLSGEQIDLFFTYDTSILAKRIVGGMVEDLAGYEGDKFVKENIGDDGIYKYENKLYGVPTNKEPVVMVLNESIFKETGIEVPKDWTVDEFKEVAKKLTKTENGKTRYGAYAFNGGGPIDTARMILGNNYRYKDGGKESNFDNEAFKQNFFVYDMMYTDKSTYPYSEILSKKLNSGYSQDVFLNGEVAMMTFSPWMMRYVKDTAKYPHDWKATFAPLPVPEKGKEYYNPGQLNNWLSINSKSEHKKEAWDFLKYWTTEGSLFLVPGGKIPVWNKVNADEVAKTMLGENADKLFDQEAFKRVMLDPNIKYVIDDISVAAPEITQIIKEETDKLYLKEQSVDQYLSNLKKRSDEAIAKSAK